jgi:hypothetical protein
MATEPLHDSAGRIPGGEMVGRVRRPEARSPEPVVAAAQPLDIIQALGELQDSPDLAAMGLADALLAWLTPRPRNPGLLAQARIAPLLGLAIDMLRHHRQANPDVAGLGASALEQELRTQRTLAERRAASAAGSP